MCVCCMHMHTYILVFAFVRWHLATNYTGCPANEWNEMQLMHNLCWPYLFKKEKKEICKFDSVHLRTPCETKFRLIKKYHLQTVFCGYCRQYLELTGNSTLTPSHSLLPNVEHADPKLPTLLHPGVGFCTPQVINAFSSCLKGVPEPSLKQFILY